MAKQRNSLGILVMPLTGGERISWSEYKNRTGIDLEKMLVIMNYGSSDNPDYHVEFKHDAPSKLILLENSSEELRPIPPIVVPNFTKISNVTLALSRLTLKNIDDESGAGVTLSFYADKTVSGGAF